MKSTDLKKRFVLLAFLVTMIVSFPISLYADEDDGDDGDPIDLTFEQQNGVPIGRSLVHPVEAYYNAETGKLLISFSQIEGIVTVVLTNMTTGSFSTAVINTSIGNYVFPVTGGSGLYCLEILISDGARYYGYFII